MRSRHPLQPLTITLSPGLGIARGAAVGGWLGIVLASLGALLQQHSPLTFLTDLFVSCLPLAGMGGLIGFLVWQSLQDVSPAEPAASEFEFEDDESIAAA